MPIGSSDVAAPYTQTEVRDLRGWVGGLSTSAKRHNTEVILACGLGAGLTAQEIGLVAGPDVEATTDGVRIDVPGANARRVWVAARWERVIVTWAEHVGSRPLFRPDRTTPLRRGATNYVDGLPQGIGVPRLSILRCRTTWIVEHLDSGVPLDVLAAAAGVDPKGLGRYVEFMQPTSDEVARTMLRGRT